MKTTTIALSFALVLTSVQAADAADANGQYRIEGVGNIHCREAEFMGYFNIRKIDESAALTSWMLGYITAANAYLPQGNLLRVRSMNEWLDWMGDFCRRCPYDNIGGGMQILVLELQQALTNTTLKPEKIPREVQAKEGCEHE